MYVSRTNYIHIKILEMKGTRPRLLLRPGGPEAREGSNWEEYIYIVRGEFFLKNILCLPFVRWYRSQVKF